jgi:mercuric reductase
MMAENKQIEFDIQGMTCNSCALHLEKTLKSVPGVQTVAVPGWQSGKATVTMEGEIDRQSLETAVKRAGYRAKLKERRPEGEEVAVPASGGQGKARYDLMVIGGGSAGFAAAIKGAELGYRIALVEAGTLGGTCVNVGCGPSKTLIRALEQSHQAAQHRFEGVETMAGRLNWPLVIDQKDKLVEEMRQSKYLDVLAAYPEITYIQGRARLSGGNGVDIEGVSHTPGKIVIATGARPWAPPIPGLVEAGYLTSTTVMELKELLNSMIVLGANAVGLELAQTFARAGVKITLLELMPSIAPFEEPEISAALADYLKSEGLQMITGFQTLKVERRDGRFFLSGKVNEKEFNLNAEQLLVATGRRPNTGGMDLEQAGVHLGEQGEIRVDDTLKTDNPFIYAAGDVTGRDMFVYAAAYGGSLAAKNALTGAGKSYDASYIPRITFTDPQIASAGLTEGAARQQGFDVQVSSLPMSYVPRALAARDTRGLVKLVVNASKDQLLGAHFLAPEAGEMIQIAVLAIRFGITSQQLRETMFPYLTNSEAVKLAVLGLEKDVSLLSCCAG